MFSVRGSFDEQSKNIIVPKILGSMNKPNFKTLNQLVPPALDYMIHPKSSFEKHNLTPRIP